MRKYYIFNYTPIQVIYDFNIPAVSEKELPQKSARIILKESEAHGGKTTLHLPQCGDLYLDQGDIKEYAEPSGYGKKLAKQNGSTAFICFHGAIITLEHVTKQAQQNIEEYIGLIEEETL